MGDLVLAIDQGTTGTTALLVDQSIRVVAAHNVEFPNHYPEPGHVEHDVREIWQSVGAAVGGALAKAEASADRIRRRMARWGSRTSRPATSGQRSQPSAWSS